MPRKGAHVEIAQPQPLPELQLIRLSAAAKLIPGHPATCTVWRWATRGCRGRRLWSRQIGGLRFTTAQAVEEFLAHCEESAGCQFDQEDDGDFE